jgi:hypothetical protein
LHLIAPPSPHHVNPFACAQRFYEEHKKEIEGFSVQSAYHRADWCPNGRAVG